jgi:hypothetical protein
MLETFYAVIRVSIACVALWLVFSGFGLLCFAACGRKSLNAWDLLRLPWLGWAGAVLVLQLWHCFLPIDGRAISVLALVGIGGLVINTTKLLELVRSHRAQVAWSTGLLLVLSLWMANQTVRQPGIYDSGLYHLNSVRWAYSYPIVAGLGNLHGRLAFNNSSFLYTAMLDVGPFRHKSHQLASGFLMLCLMIPCVCAWWRVFKEGERDCKMLFYAFSFAPLLVWIVVSGFASSPSPDVPCFVLAIWIGGELLGLLSLPREATREAAHSFRVIVLLSLVGLTVKLSFAFFAAGACAVALFILLHRRVGAPWKPFAAAAVIGMFTVFPWMVRGVILSGYPAYPARLMKMGVDWGVSESSRAAMVWRIKSWARDPSVDPEVVMGTLSWVKPWFLRVIRENLLDFTFPLLTIAIAVVVLLSFIRGKRLKLSDARWLILLPPLAGLAIWLSAPDPRFQGSLLWVLAIGTLVLVHHFGNYAARWSLLGHGLVILGLLMNPLDLVRTWKDPGPAKQVDMSLRTTRSGLRVLVPGKGDQAWDAALPATPYFSPWLRLRVEGDMSKGFIKRKGEVITP